MIMKKILNKIIFFINSLFLFLLLLSNISVYINPNIFWPISFLGLLFPLLFVINFFFLVYWVILLKKNMIANIIVLILSYSNISNYIGVANKENIKKDTIKVLSYNVRIFNAYGWIPQLKKETIYNYLKKENADILCIQEFYVKDEIPKMNYKYHHIGKQSKKSKWHMAIYSKYKQIYKATVTINGEKMNNTCIFSDIIIKNDTIRVYNIHLASNWFKESDYYFINNPNKETIYDNIIAVVNKMKETYKSRAKEALAIRKHINNSPYPVIVCGDFNDTPMSYAYKKIKGDLSDSFSKSGQGIGSSFVKIPALRIDYILYDKKFKSTNYKKDNIILSDHFPISCEIQL